MAAEINPGGCERCGRTEDIHYVHWQFLCTECLKVLKLEEAHAHEFAKVLTRLGPDQDVVLGGAR